MQPFKIYRNKKGWPKWYQPLVEAYWIITDKWSLHKAWQQGLDKGSAMEYQRIIKNMGEIEAQRKCDTSRYEQGNPKYPHHLTKHYAHPPQHHPRPLKCLLCRKPIVAGERYKKKRVGTEWHEVCVV